MYSQNLEEKFVLKYAGDQGRFLDVGANDGVHLSNTRALAERGWTGVLVEPSPYWLPKLIANYPDERRHTIIGAPLWFKHEVAKFWATEDIVNTMSPQLMEARKHRYSYRMIYAHGIVWEDLQEIGPFDVINIDIEGPTLPMFKIMPEKMLADARVVIVEHNGGNYRVPDGFEQVYKSPENFVIVNERCLKPDAETDAQVLFNNAARAEATVYRAACAGDWRAAPDVEDDHVRKVSPRRHSRRER